MKKMIAFLAFILCHTLIYSQIFKSQNEDLINFNSKEVKIIIDSSTYKGEFVNFTSKKDKKEYLIYSYFSRSVIVSLNTLVEKIDENTPEINIDRIKLIHSSDINSIIKAVGKNGLSNIENFITVYESLNSDIKLLNCNLNNENCE